MTDFLAITDERLTQVEEQGVGFQWAGFHKAVSVDDLRAAMVVVDVEDEAMELREARIIKGGTGHALIYREGVNDLRDRLLARINEGRPCDHDYTASFQGGDTYRCRKCGKEIDITEDE